MNPQTVKASSNMKIALTSDNKSLDEVIVTGYGNFKKSSFTGAAASMSTAKLSDVPSLSVEDKLSGNIPGVSISSFSGQPGAMNYIRIRGMGSINAGNDPLVVNHTFDEYRGKNVGCKARLFPRKATFFLPNLVLKTTLFF